MLYSRLYFLLLVVFSFSLTGQPATATVQDRVARWVSDAQVTGLSGAYFENGQISPFTTGYADAETRRAVTDTTVFSAASLSKPVLAYLVWQLADEGRLQLDSTASTYCTYPDLVHDARARTVTIRQLLTHHSGLPNWRDGDTLRFKQDPGTGFSYSGEGFVWLSHLVEHLTNKDYATLARERIFTPLGMTHSSMVFEDRFSDDYAVPYETGERSTTDHKWNTVNAAASLQTTATDYARFLLALMERTDYLHQRLPVETAMWDDSPTPLPGAVGWSPGLAWQRNQHGYTYWHWGHNTGFRAYFTILPGEHRGLVFFTNDSTGLDLVPALTEQFDLGDQPGWRWAGYE